MTKFIEVFKILHNMFYTNGRKFFTSSLIGVFAIMGFFVMQIEKASSNIETITQINNDNEETPQEKDKY